MKSPRFQTKKFDSIFVIAVIAVVVAAIVASTLFSGNSYIPDKPLPDKSDSNITKLVISELMSNNGGIYVNDNNEACDYLELYNGTDKKINLAGYGLSDKQDTVKWVFPSTELNPGEYVVVGLTGRLENGLNAPFRLTSKGEERIILVNPNSKVIDAVDTVALDKNQAMMRDKDGNWFISDFGTPGYANSKEGQIAYYESLKSEEAGELVINEFLNRNKANFMKNGTAAGFIEFINISDHNVDLGEYTLGKTTENPFLRNLDSRILAPGDIYCIFTGSGDDNLGFRFENENGTVILSKKGRIVDEIEYHDLGSGVAICRNNDGSYSYTNIVSPGYRNTTDGVDSFQKEYLKNPRDLMINEVMSSNHSYLPQNGNQFYDWIELKNNSGIEINLSDYCLGKNDSNLEQYHLPDVTLAPGEFYILMASGDEKLTNNSYYHTNFKISSADTIYLSRNHRIVDCVNLSEIPYQYSYGRGKSDGFFYLSEPTPGSENGTGYRMVAAVPEIVSGGVYNGVSSVAVEIKGQGTVRYTTDGSFPTAYSAVYTGPFNVTGTTVVKARSYMEDAVTSNSAVASFIVNENHSLPVMSLSLDPDDFSYLNYNSNTRGLELQAYAQLYDGDDGFSIPCSIACFGGNSRNDEKKSYALRFDSDWGASDLVYHLFDNRDNSVFDAIVLRSGSNDISRTIFRDILATGAADPYMDVQAYKSCVLYINGDYWGIYNIREKINRSFICDHYNVDKDKVNIVHVSGYVEAGTDGISEIFDWVRSHDMSNDANYQYVSQLIDIDNVIDYWIYMTYYANRDVANIRYFSHPDVDGGRWKYILYDVDYGFRYPTYNYYYSYLTNPNGMTGWVENTYDNVIPRKLFNNSTFRNKWLERMNYLLHHELSIASLTERCNVIINSYAPEIARDRERWYGSYLAYDFGIPITLSSYNQQKQIVLDYIKVRQSYVLSQTQEFFGLSSASMKQIFGDLW